MRNSGRWLLLPAQILKNTEQIVYKIFVQNLKCRNSSLSHPPPPSPQHSDHFEAHITGGEIFQIVFRSGRKAARILSQNWSSDCHLIKALSRVPLSQTHAPLREGGSNDPQARKPISHLPRGWVGRPPPEPSPGRHEIHATPRTTPPPPPRSQSQLHRPVAPPSRARGEGPGQHLIRVRLVLRVRVLVDDGDARLVGQPDLFDGHVIDDLCTRQQQAWPCPRCSPPLLRAAAHEAGNVAKV